eukprot:CAMPEP_0196769408 /NCGR_PEP_ID=MMETSP1104-20130614/518_1 /TAXON_ID=33652 /ORGANISM="Cafeteria sp., Strain Caron Lab Isolate" /LENGTH=332 /DNA_ID=CAMNT_0042139503 /DNA_START=53 /DNA_END=1051 /DNA_ORIENTATION=+
MAAKKADRRKPRTVVPIVILFVIFIFLYASFLVLHVPRVGDDNADEKRESIVAMVVMHAFFLLFTISLLLVIYTEPGSVPHEAPWDPSKASAKASVMVEKKADGRLRFCRTCGTYKPDRCHHDSATGQCVLEMDHYCPWIYNCVGYRNRKYFILTLLYGCGALHAYIYFMLPAFKTAAQGLDEIVVAFLTIFAFFLASLLALVLTGFFFFHCWLVSNQFTTIEYCEKRKNKDKKNEMGKGYADLHKTSVYDQGMYQNICHVLGNPFMWFFPTNCSRKGDGIHFEFDRDHALVRHRQDLARQERESLRKAVAAGEAVETPVPPSPSPRGQGCV